MTSPAPDVEALLRLAQQQTQANRYVFLRKQQNASIVKQAVQSGQSR